MEDHKSFQDGQAFINAKGFRGVQLDTLQPGFYYINPLLFRVEAVDTLEVPPGYVAVLRSNVGEELEKSTSTPTEVRDDPDFDQTLHTEIESLLTQDKYKRGIIRAPLAPGKYNLNTRAFQSYLVPTSAIMIDWASEDPKNISTSERDKSFFKFSELTVTSKDGFQLEVDVRLIVRILPENAPFIIARFGSVINLIQQIIHPVIDAEFRNSAGTKEALEFVKTRTELQTDALNQARKAFAPYYVETQNLLISYISVDATLLKTQTDKQIAIQQQAQYDQQAEAEKRRIAVAEQTARANKQPEVVQAILNIDINKNNANALIEEARGIKESTRIKAEGEGAAIETVGNAQGKAYKAQTDVIGSQNVALIRVMEEIKEGKIQITPEVLVQGADGGSNLFQAFLAQLIREKNNEAGVQSS